MPDAARRARQSLAVDISLAALLGDNIYNFGELLLHPIVRPRPATPSRTAVPAVMVSRLSGNMEAAVSEPSGPSASKWRS